MAGENENDGYESQEEEACGKTLPSYGTSRYSRRDFSIEDRIKFKNERESRQSASGLSRRKGLNRGGALRPISKKQQKKLQQYKKAREQHYSNESNRECYLCGSTNNLSIHHMEKRGNNIDKKESFVTLCLIGNYMDDLYPDSNHNHTGGCHAWIEANKSIARELELL